MKVHWRLALFRAAVEDDAQVSGFQGPLRYRLTRKFCILRGRERSRRCAYRFNSCLFRLKGGKTRPKRIYLAGKHTKWQ